MLPPLPESLCIHSQHILDSLHYLRFTFMNRNILIIFHFSSSFFKHCYLSFTIIFFFFTSYNCDPSEEWKCWNKILHSHMECNVQLLSSLLPIQLSKNWIYLLEKLLLRLQSNILHFFMQLHPRHWKVTSSSVSMVFFSLGISRIDGIYSIMSGQKDIFFWIILYNILQIYHALTMYSHYY